jgi:phosphoesterase RecJ-like protein
LLDQLQRVERMALMTHVGPDADGLGCEIAFCRAARAAGKDAFIVNEDPCPARYAWLDPARVVSHFSRDHGQLDRAEMGLVFDAHEEDRVERPGRYLRERGIPLWVVDHHAVRPDADLTGVVATQFSSSGELVYRLLRDLRWPIGPDVAMPLYAAISFDTGSFRFLRNQPETLRVAADLLATGFDANPVQEALFASRPRNEVTLLGRVLDRVRYEADGAVAWAALDPSVTAGLDVAQDAVGETIPFLIGTDGVLVAVMIKPGRKPGEWKLSLRSKAAVTIGHIAHHFGGGGHAHAAGATMHGDLDALAREVVLAAVAAVRDQTRPSAQAA